MSTVQFWFGGDQFVLDADNVWTEMDARWPEGVEKPNPAVAERIIREIADPVEDGDSA